MKTSYIWILLLAIIVSLSACKKSDNAPNPAPNPPIQSALIKTWKVSLVQEAGFVDITGVFSQYRLTFEETNGSKNFTLVQRDGTSVTGTWDISGDGTTITLNTGSNTITLSEVSISDSSLKYTTDEQGKTGLVKLNFSLIPA